MPHHWHFPRWRHFTMQAIMWVLLGASVGLAALANHHLRDAHYISLSNPIVDDAFTFRLPEGWKTDSARTGANSIYLATESDESDAQRIITINHLRIGAGISPLELIRRQLGPGVQMQQVNSVSLDGHPAQYVRWAAVRLVDNQPVETEGVNCCLILPSHDAFTFQFERTGPIDISDSRLVHQVLDSVKISTPN
jgi:hypothetical protein